MSIPTAVLVLFCRASLMGYQAIGIDLDPRMVKYSQQNMVWLNELMAQTYPVKIHQGDALKFNYNFKIDAVVSEGYLGPVFSKPPTPFQLSQIKAGVTQLTLNFFTHLHPYLPAQTPICFSLPCWQIGGRIYHLDIIDQIISLGYNIERFTGIAPQELTYIRPNQIVGRELLTVRKIDGSH